MDFMRNQSTPDVFWKSVYEIMFQNVRQRKLQNIAKNDKWSIRVRSCLLDHVTNHEKECYNFLQRTGVPKKCF